MSIVNYKNVEILRKEHIVLKNVDFELNQGEFIYLLGKVGSGKSSLLKSMYAEIPITQGEATVLDYDLVGIKRNPHVAQRNWYRVSRFPTTHRS